MSAAQRIRDAEKALGKDADDYSIEYEDNPEDSDTGRPQLILCGEIIDKEMIKRLSAVGFEFQYAQVLGFDDDDETTEEEEEGEEVEETSASEGEGEDDDDIEFVDDIEIVFDDMKAKAKK